MGIQQQIGPVPMPAVSRVLAQFDRDQLAGFVEVAIGLMDLVDGDVDIEDATDLEDDFALSSRALLDAGDGPGCPISDGQGDQAYVEWTSMRGSQRRGPNLTLGEEDDEDADGDGACTDDEPAFDARSRRIANYLWADGPGCPFGDPGGCEHDGREP